MRIEKCRYQHSMTTLSADTGCRSRSREVGTGVFALIFICIVALAMLFWVVEIVRAKIGRRPPSWKQPHEPPPKTSLGNAFWGRGISPPPSFRRKPPPESNTDDV
jgi:hypothetical protein